MGGLRGGISGLALALALVMSAAMSSAWAHDDVGRQCAAADPSSCQGEYDGTSVKRARPSSSAAALAAAEAAAAAADSLDKETQARSAA
eukprot:CAMPEP_0181389406 /NCGR_PEP_ID=MMETSP1106-20121128/24898_1 /TAXON_ID=81844 /ORGANISM="Mantoniella antarctica, Strain SL-175" /LENGTH=88 /DNA_ID=CAMNT_0023510175 /DNA_START=120 /DNA_END=383 /DNA_ORIENTATION=+